MVLVLCATLVLSMSLALSSSVLCTVHTDMKPYFLTNSKFSLLCNAILCDRKLSSPLCKTVRKIKQVFCLCPCYDGAILSLSPPPSNYIYLDSQNTQRWLVGKLSPQPDICRMLVVAIKFWKLFTYDNCTVALHTVVKSYLLPLPPFYKVSICGKNT